MGEVGHLLLLDLDERGRLEGSAVHPTRALPQMGIDLPGAVEAGNLGLET
jgi:hypothetical protein